MSLRGYPWFNRRKQALWLMERGYTADRVEAHLLHAYKHGLNARSWGMGMAVVARMRELEGSHP